MSVYLKDKIDEKDIGNFIGVGTYAKVYKYKKDEVLKRYRDDDIREYLEKFHNYEFLNYLEKLSKYSSSILVVPNDIFINEYEQVDSYSMDFCDGICLTEDLSEFDIEKLMKILKNFYDELMQIDNLLLNDTHPNNLIISDSLKIIDLDYSLCIKQNEDVKNMNLEQLNYNIFRSLVRRKYILHGIIDENILNILSGIKENSMRLDQLLEEYIEYINKHIRKVEKVKDLRCSYVSKF